nr:ferrous iron transport protein A [Clostridioides difficile]
MTVYNLKLGQKGIIDNIAGNEKLMKRLLALGLIDGTEVEVKKIAPLNDPIVIRFRGFDLAIRTVSYTHLTLPTTPYV